MVYLGHIGYSNRWSDIVYASDKILNTICDLRTSSGINLTGNFVKPGSNIWFAGRMKIEDLRKLDRGETFDLVGTVNGRPIYIEGANISNSTTSGFNPEYVNVTILPHEIIIGEKKKEKNFITSLSVSFPELNYFFNSRINHVFDDGYILKEDQLDFKPIIYSKDKLLSISSGTKISSSTINFNLESVYITNLIFDTEESLEFSLRQISIFRLLIILISDSFIPLPSELIVYTKDHKQEDNHSNITIWLNDNRHRYPIRENKPFLIIYEDIKDSFDQIWLSWFSFYEQPLNSPMIELIYQIISNQSIGLNRFLNICQALEVYSNQYRNQECKELFRDYQSKGLTEAKRVTLQVRIADLLILHNDIFPYNEDEVFELSSDIADLRNYYTHYNPKKQRILEYKYSDIRDIYSRFDYSLYALLLATIYKEINIPTFIIKDSLENFETRFGKTLNELFEGPDV